MSTWATFLQLRKPRLPLWLLLLQLSYDLTYETLESYWRGRLLLSRVSCQPHQLLFSCSCLSHSCCSCCYGIRLPLKLLLSCKSHTFADFLQLLKPRLLPPHLLLVRLSCEATLLGGMRLLLPCKPHTFAVLLQLIQSFLTSSMVGSKCILYLARACQRSYWAWRFLPEQLQDGKAGKRDAEHNEA